MQDSEYDVVLLDINLPDYSGLELLPIIQNLADAPEIIMLTSDQSLKTGLEAMRLGAYDYLTKPTIGAQLETVIKKAFEKRKLVKQNQQLRSIMQRQNKVEELKPVYRSPQMQKIIVQAERIALLPSTVLITGESGTGKDVLARWIHANSPRSSLPLVTVNCGAFPENLFESEFFGYEKGAFTGADSSKTGLIESAENSTLFLDEIGELPLVMQVKLLHFLENGIIRRVGSTRDKKIDVRVIAATNRSLADDVANSNFRADLYYRLNVVGFHIPPLRERTEDIETLVDYFLIQLQQKLNRPNLVISDSVREKLFKFEWLGNIRELKNSLERAVILSETDIIDNLGGFYQNSMNSNNDITRTTKFYNSDYTLSELEKLYIRQVLTKTNGHREKAASILGINVRTLFNKIQEIDEVI